MSTNSDDLELISFLDELSAIKLNAPYEYIRIERENERGILRKTKSEDFLSSASSVISDPGEYGGPEDLQPLADEVIEFLEKECGQLDTDEGDYVPPKRLFTVKMRRRSSIDSLLNPFKSKKLESELVAQKANITPYGSGTNLPQETAEEEQIEDPESEEFLSISTSPSGTELDFVKDPKVEQVSTDKDTKIMGPDAYDVESLISDFMKMERQYADDLLTIIKVTIVNADGIKPIFKYLGTRRSIKVLNCWEFRANLPSQLGIDGSIRNSEYGSEFHNHNE